MALSLRLPRGKPDWVMLGLGLLAVVLSGYSLYWGNASTRWPRQEAVVTESRVQSASKGAIFLVRYDYDCAGRRCSGDRWHYRIFSSSPDTIWGSGARAAAAAATYPVGKRVHVAVDPGNPRESALEPGMSADDLTVMAVGALLVLLAFMGVRSDVVRTASTTSADGGGTGVDGSTAVPYGDTSSRRKRGGLARLLTGIALLMLAYGGYVLYRSHTKAGWPEVAGTVVYRDLRSASGWIGSHRAVVRYEYIVGGTRYVGDATVRSAGDSAMHWIAPLIKDGPVRVRVNPADPSDSSIEPGGEREALTWAAFAVALLAVAWATRKASAFFAARFAVPGRR